MSTTEAVSPADTAPQPAFDVEAARDAYMAELVAAGILLPTGVPGVSGKNAAFEYVIEGIVRAVARASAADGADLVRFPPVITRANFVKSGHLKSFPHLSGSIHSFMGDDRAHLELLRKAEAGERWTDDLDPTDLVLTPACCYPVYPMAAGKGVVPAGGRLYDILGYCFRHEPSNDPMRMQMFRMQEHVRMGTPEQVSSWREMWFERAQTILESLRVPFLVDVANDPFFGRGGRLMAANQRSQELKFELNVPIIHEDFPTACVSLNYHQDHFGHMFGLSTTDGNEAHTGCIGFGLERLTLGMFRFHGFDLDAWPSSVRKAIDP